MATRSLNVVISGDAKQLGVATKKAEGHLDSLSSKGAKMGKALALGFAAAGAAAGTAFVVGLKKSAEAAMDAEKSQARLQAQLKASGISYRAHAKEIDAVIQKHSRLAGVDDEDLQDAFTNIVRATGSVSKSMKDVGLVTDLMRAKHMDAARAGDLLAKVHNGNVGALKRMGIAIDPVTKAQDRLKETTKNATAEQTRAAKEADKTATATKAIAELQRRVGGQAEAYGKTAAGAQERFSVAVENLEEKLGAKLLPVIANITNKVATFVGQMESGRGAGGRFANAVSEGFNRAKQVVERAVSAIRGFLDRNREDINSLITAFRRVASIARDVFQDTMLPIIRRTIKAVGDQIDGLVHVIRGLVRIVSGLLSGDWSKAWDGAKEVVRGAFKVIKTAIVNNLQNILKLVKDLGPKIVKGIGQGLINMDKAILTGIMRGLQAAAKALPGVAGGVLKGIGHAITSGISKGFGTLNPFGDGLGKTSLPPTSAMSGGNSLMGADSDLGWIASTAARFGLHTSSGLRPGSITSSGNVSFHSSGDALDEAGSPAGMMAYFRYMKAKYGPVLRELIYTPGGVGIKDGKPFQYTGQVAADHYDHVHTAFTGGKGDGTGDGIGQAVSAARSAGFKGSDLVEAVAIAGAESHYNAGAMNLKYPDHSIGFWQINQLAHHGRFGTDSQLKNPFTNAKAAYALYKESGFRPWSTYPSAAAAYLSQARAAVSGSRGSGGPSGSSGGSGGTTHGKTYKQGQTSSGGLGGYDPTVVYAAENDAAVQYDPFTGRQEGAAGFAQRKASPVLTARPMKGGGPTKGFPSGYVPPEPAGPADPRSDPRNGWLQGELSKSNADLALAALTPDTADDLAALQRIHQIRGGELDIAKESGDYDWIAEAATNFKSATDAINQLTEATKENTDAIEEQRKAFETLIAQDYQKQFNVSQSQYAVLAQAIADVANGGIGQRLGLSLSGLRAAPGAVART